MLIDVPMPPTIASLPRDGRGYPIPYFVAHVNGVPDLRVADARAQRRCHRRRLCWVCGGRLGPEYWWLMGPLGLQHGVSSEYAMHRACAEYAAIACPFLNGTLARRRPNLPEGTEAPLGAVDGQPGLPVALAVSAGYTVLAPRGRGLLFRMRPKVVQWYRGGQAIERPGRIAECSG